MVLLRIVQKFNKQLFIATDKGFLETVLMIFLCEIY